VAAGELGGRSSMAGCWGWHYAPRQWLWWWWLAKKEAGQGCAFARQEQKT